ALRERHLRDGRVERPTAHLERRLGHVMAAHVRAEQGVYGFGPFDVGAEYPRREPLAHGEPGRIDRFGTVVGERSGHALGPDRSAVAIAHFEEQNPPLVLHTRRDSKRLFERESDLAHDDTVDAKHVSASWMLNFPFPSRSPPRRPPDLLGESGSRTLWPIRTRPVKARRVVLSVGPTSDMSKARSSLKWRTLRDDPLGTAALSLPSHHPTCHDRPAPACRPIVPGSRDAHRDPGVRRHDVGRATALRRPALAVRLVWIVEQCAHDPGGGSARRPRDGLDPRASRYAARRRS